MSEHEEETETIIDAIRSVMSAIKPLEAHEDRENVLRAAAILLGIRLGD
jgi:hypothetical protein